MTKEERKIYNKEYNLKNKEKIKLYEELNREKRRKYNKKRNKNPLLKLKQREYEKKHISLNKESKRKYHRDYIKDRCKTDPLFKLKKCIRENITQSLKRNNYNKSSRTEQILGCSFEEFKQYLESQFKPWMNWDNHGIYNGELNYGWDIDHIIPVSSAQTEKEILILSHYTNLQPLCSKVNRDIKRERI